MWKQHGNWFTSAYFGYIWYFSITTRLETYMILVTFKTAIILNAFFSISFSSDVKFFYFIQNEAVCMISHSCAKSNNSLYDYNDTRPIIEAQQVIASGEGFRQLRTDTRNYRT